MPLLAINGGGKRSGTWRNVTSAAETESTLDRDSISKASELNRFKPATEGTPCDGPGGLRLPETALILKGTAKLDIHVSVHHRPHPCGLTL